MTLSKEQLFLELKKMILTTKELEEKTWEEYIDKFNFYLERKVQADFLLEKFKLSIKDLAKIEYAAENYKKTTGKTFPLANDKNLKNLFNDKILIEMVLDIKHMFKQILEIQDILTEFETKHEIEYTEDNLNLLLNLFKNYNKNDK